MDENPRMLRVVESIRLEADQRRIMDRALSEATPLEKAGFGAPTSRGDRSRLRGTPIMTKGVPGTMPGTDPLGAVLAREHRLDRKPDRY